MSTFGPTDDQQSRVKRLQYPAIARLATLFGLDQSSFSPAASGMALALEFSNQAAAAEIDPADIELALIFVVMPGLLDDILQRLEIAEPVGAEGKDAAWFGRVRARARAAKITWLQVKAARHAASGPMPGNPEPPKDWKAPDSERLEKLIEKQSTLLPIAFLERGLQRSTAVAKVEMTIDGKKGFGTGFVVERNLLVTNAHVLPSAAVAKDAKAKFKFQASAEGFDLEPVIVALDPGKAFVISPANEYDLAVVALGEEPNGRWAHLVPKTKKLIEGDPVCIIQHPAGERKQIGMHHNTVTFADDRIVQYLTDTLPGSSGSPVFDRDWDLVAIHHAGGWLREPSTKRTLFRNEGIQAAWLMEMLKTVP